ncbi:hypothetical protein FSCG_01036 [Fusobacterium vincentii 4_1_13]|uniref:Replication protein n=1 Tax=Fusobacterium vincentii 4_1_13 TaxID=469606 RepID=A0A0M1VUJ0_FUSVC|nr:hypothetical protein [Fusobacterium vincentii]EEO40323.1 hypothetical protein FSCG_01036 [Fusobacterium vincentii 4_1_13]
MAIIKIIKRDCPYVTIDKTGIDDPNLSWAATGLLTYLIGRPGNWKINITHLSGVKLDGERATRGALLELREANYCHYFEIRKKGKVVETIYLVFEVPISYEEAIKNYIDLKDDEQILYKEVKKKEPKVQNEVSVKSIENKEVLPKVQNAKTNNAKGENEGLLIIDTTNNRTTNKKTTTSENKKSSSFLEENSSGKEMINELLKKYNLSKSTRKNILNLYLKKSIKKERIIEVFNISKEKGWGEGAIYKALKENWNIQAKNIPVVTEDEIRNKIRIMVNYHINVFEATNNFKETKNRLIEEFNQINGFEYLKSEYLKKFEEHIDNKKNIKNNEKSDIDLSIERFLKLEKELQDTIKEKAEKLYNGPFETLNQLKRKTSDIFYLKFIWTEILKTIDNEYPNIVGINGGIK